MAGCKKGFNLQGVDAGEVVNGTIVGQYELLIKLEPIFIAIDASIIVIVVHISSLKMDRCRKKSFLHLLE